MAQVQTFHIEAGASFAQQLTYTDDNGDLFDLTGYVAAFQARESVESPEPVLDLILPIDVETATIALELSPEQTSSLTALRYKYAVELTAPDETVTRLLQGSLKVSPEVVR